MTPRPPWFSNNDVSMSMSSTAIIVLFTEVDGERTEMFDIDSRLSNTVSFSECRLYDEVISVSVLRFAINPSLYLGS